MVGGELTSVGILLSTLLLISKPNFQTLTRRSAWTVNFLVRHDLLNGCIFETVRTYPKFNDLLQPQKIWIESKVAFESYFRRVQNVDRLQYLSLNPPDSRKSNIVQRWPVDRILIRTHWLRVVNVVYRIHVIKHSGRLPLDSFPHNLNEKKIKWNKSAFFWFYECSIVRRLHWYMDILRFLRSCCKPLHSFDANI